MAVLVHGLVHVLLGDLVCIFRFVLVLLVVLDLVVLGLVARGRLARGVLSRDVMLLVLLVLHARTRKHAPSWSNPDDTSTADSASEGLVPPLYAPNACHFCMYPTHATFVCTQRVPLSYALTLTLCDSLPYH